MKDVILASQSPRRKLLLEWAEIPFEIIVKHTDESFDPSLSVEEAVMQVAHNKALTVKAYVQKTFDESFFDKTILAADTIVVLNQEIIGKPEDRNEAIATLTKLAGKEHQVITGVAILHKEGETMFYDTTLVKFHPLSLEQICYYVDKYEPFDKAGAYAIQEWIGVVGIASIVGDFYNVMGLPVNRVVKLLQSL